jgi:predicted ATPase/DNA-binding CsgD family transcriptional regulator
VPATSFVGRRAELAQARRLLTATRLLTLTGPGGVGKTRLAARVAEGAVRGFPDGVWLVPLAAVRDGALVPHAVADALGIRDETGRAPLDTVVGHLRDRRLLLVLDNCEHVTDACASLVAAVLGATGGVRVLATSRHRLGLTEEQLLPVAPLATPAPGDVLHGRESPALRLFADRAAAVAPGFKITDHNRAAVARLCNRLDGLPLAIELAAVRMHALGVEQLDERLGEHLGAHYRLLTCGSPAAPPRHRTLRSAVDWSHDLCTPAEQLAWAHLSVFTGGFDLAGAEAVCGDTFGGRPTKADRAGAEGAPDPGGASRAAGGTGVAQPDTACSCSGPDQTGASLAAGGTGTGKAPPDTASSYAEPNPTEASHTASGTGTGKAPPDKASSYGAPDPTEASRTAGGTSTAMAQPDTACSYAEPNPTEASHTAGGTGTGTAQPDTACSYGEPIPASPTQADDGIGTARAETVRAETRRPYGGPAPAAATRARETPTRPGGLANPETLLDPGGLAEAAGAGTGQTRNRPGDESNCGETTHTDDGTATARPYCGPPVVPSRVNGPPTRAKGLAEPGGRAEAVGAASGVARGAVLDAVVGLVEKSVLVREVGGVGGASGTRYRMLALLREYGLEKLEALGAAGDTRRRLCAHFVRVAEEHERSWFGPDQPGTLAGLRAEHDNLRAALDFCLTTPGESPRGLRLVGSLWFYWIARGAWAELRHWWQRLLLRGGRRPPPELTRAHWAAALIPLVRSRTNAVLRAGTPHPPTLAPHEIPDVRPLTDVLGRRTGRAGHDRVGDDERRLLAFHLLSRVEMAATLTFHGRAEHAVPLCVDALAVCEAYGEQWVRSYVLGALATARWALGEHEAAAESVRRCLRLPYVTGEPHAVGGALEILAVVTAARGDTERAAVLRGAAHRIRYDLGHDPPAGRRLARKAPGDGPYGEAHRRGFELSVREALAYALGEPRTAAPRAAVPSAPDTGLTRRELEVAALIASGMTNRQIAERLVISRRTAEGHAERILAKLGFAARSQVAAWFSGLSR